MIYMKAKALVEEYEAEDVIVTSAILNTEDNFYDNDQECAQTSWDVEYCDGVTQAVSKSQY